MLINFVCDLLEENLRNRAIMEDFGKKLFLPKKTQTYFFIQAKNLQIKGYLKIISILERIESFVVF